MNINPKRQGMTVFSGTDLKKDINNPGICFPFGDFEEKNKPTFGSIILLSGSKTVVARTEYRTANREGDSIVYSKHRCLSFVKSTTTKPTLVEQLMGVQPVDNSYVVSDKLSTDSILSTNIHEQVADMLNSIEFTASTDFIDEENLSKPEIIKYGKNKTTTGSLFNPVYPSLSNDRASCTFDKKNIDTIPPRQSKEWREVASEVEDFFDILLVPVDIIIKMSQTDKMKYYGEMYEAVYLKKIDVPKDLAIMDIIKLQDKIWLETRVDIKLVEDMYGVNKPTIEEMKEDLVSWGVDKLEIATSSDVAIEKWWKDVMIEVDGDDTNFDYGKPSIND